MLAPGVTDTLGIPGESEQTAPVTPEHISHPLEVDVLVGTYKFMLRQATSFINSLRGKTCSERMKTKNFYVLVLFLLATVTSFWILIDPSPNIHTIVSETHKQISNIKNIPTNIRHTKKELLEVDKKYLNVLGYPLTTDPVPTNVSKTVILETEPVIVVPVLPGNLEASRVFLSSASKYLASRLVIFIDLGLNSGNNLVLRKLCNSTRYNCEVKVFKYTKYPSHVRSHNLGSYVPICIQESLNKYHAIIWSHPEEYFITKDITGIVNKARQSGIVAWTVEDPASSITYNKMFTYFDVKPTDYYFQRAAKTSHLVVYNTEFVRLQIMMPWVKCALVEECISPTGSQTGYCRETRPRYLYTGCHHYEQSAFNLILGKAFDSDSSPYETNEKIFGVELFNKTVTSAALLTKDKPTS